MRLFRLGLVAVFATFAGIAQSEETSFVVPNKFADTEGQGYLILRSNFRAQQVCAASEFSALSEGNNLLTKISWRPNASAAPFSWHADRFTIQASVTDVSAAGMSMTFADNIMGPETTLFDGILDQSTQGLGPPGGPKEFDLSLVFDTPFPYDPTEGNLLLDFRIIGTFSSLGDLKLDSTSEIQQSRVIAGSIFSETAQSRLGGPIAKFTVVDSVLGDVNLDGEVNGLDVDPFVDILLNGPYQAAADMNDDQAVNGLDVDLFVAAVVGGAAQAQIPEPSTILLCIIALGVVGAWRKWGG